LAQGPAAGLAAARMAGALRAASADEASGFR